MGRGGSVEQHTPPIPDFSGIGGVIVPATKERLKRKRTERRTRRKIKLNKNK